MKKTLLFFGFALVGVVFFACQKDEPVQEKPALDSSEVVSVERSCGDDASFCDFCATAGQCCCTIEWVYVIDDDTLSHPNDYQMLERPRFCAAEDIADTLATCFILHTVYDDSLMQCTTFTTWNSTLDIFCPPIWQWPPFPPRLTYKCVPQNTAMSVRNPNTILSEIELRFILTCNTGTVSPISRTYIIPPEETLVIIFSGCDNKLDCISENL